MISPHNRLVSSFCLVMVLLSLSFIYSCKTTPPDAREELVRSLKGADVTGYLLTMKEDDNQITTSLTNGALRNPVKFDSTNRLVIGYASVKDKKTNATRIFKAEIVKRDDKFTLQTADIGSDAATTTLPFPNPGVCDSEPIFNSSAECQADFDCKERPALLCEANRTCKPQLFHRLCCLKDGNITDAFGFINPTKLTCLVTFPFDIDTVVVSR